MHRELPGLAELTVADGEQAVLKVHVVSIEPDRFAFAHAGDGDESDQDRSRSIP